MMDEILKKLLESELLNEETKAELAKAVEDFKASVRAETEAEVRADLTQQFVQAREELASIVEQKIDELVNAEFAELKEDINSFRDLEVEYAERLVEEKESLANKLSEELDELATRIDAYLDYVIDEEFAELKEDIDQVKKLEFGRKIFEAMESEFKQFRRADLDLTEQELAETKDKLADAEKRLADIEKARLTEARNSKMDELLKDLKGVAREQMRVMLSTTPTDKLQEAYNRYIGRIIKEATAEAPKADAQVVTEEVQPESSGTLVTGNEETPANKPAEQKDDGQLARIRKLAGLN